MFLATTAGPLTELGGGSWPLAGFSWWQAVGGILVVFALLVLFMRLLGRWHGKQRQGDAVLLRVLPLGHRAEVQILRLRDTVHYIYRHESALLLLGTEPHADYAATASTEDARGGGVLPGLLTRLNGLVRPAQTVPMGRLDSPAAGEQLPAG
ncbi:MAG: hypothetical protein ABIF77_14770 [bacterium]